MKKIMTRYASVAVLLACCGLPLTACGTEHPGTQAAATAGQGSSAMDETSDDNQENLPDTTSDDQGTLPDTTSDDQGTLPDTTSDDQGSLPDTTTDDGASVPTSGPNRWFPMLREFRAYLASSVPKADAALAAHVTSVRIRVPAGSARSEAVVRVDYGVGEEREADRTAAAFARWRSSLYGDHGHVDVLGPAKVTAAKDW
ncbi:hypothetical protein [Streptomyces sp. LUP30]|uniref:hypothetical protein n=1 Tax=Streptomyces sp. LUP30 TaxID=1890285 RepID=UPI0008521938|nr:hypothetical protein [Streptomyces sp. LUP30]